MVFASTRPLSVSPYCSYFFLLGTAHSRDNIFWTRLNAEELVGLLNSRSSLRCFSRDGVHEIRVLLMAPLYIKAVATLVLSSTISAMVICAGPLLNLPRVSQNTRSILAFNAKYSSKELHATSTLSSAVSSDSGATTLFTPAAAKEGSTSSSSQH